MNKWKILSLVCAFLIGTSLRHDLLSAIIGIVSILLLYLSTYKSYEVSK